jgi:predicted alpha/beta-fold hydrolase
MPALTSSFKPPRPLAAPSLQTILPALFRKPSLKGPPHKEILELPDGDFIELFWSYPSLVTEERSQLAILSHGLEGSHQSAYIIGLTRALLNAGWSVLTWNMRGCGEERNRLRTWYHSGKSDDLRAVVNHAITKFPNYSLSLIGISVGGNIVCKYLGEEGACAPSNITRAVAVSAPLDLEGSAKVLSHPSRSLYMRYLLKPLRARMREKAARFPDYFDISSLNSICTFYEFDTRFTAPAHGFQSVYHYWESSSGINFLEHITVPTLLVTALDDPFLSATCYPHALANSSQRIYLETPQHGGHVGFVDSFTLKTTWLERRVVEWCAAGVQGGVAG